MVDWKHVIVSGRWVTISGAVTTGVESIWTESNFVRNWCLTIQSVLLGWSILVYALEPTMVAATRLECHSLLTTSSLLWLMEQLPWVGFVPYPTLASFLSGLLAGSIGVQSLCHALRLGCINDIRLLLVSAIVACCTVVALCMWSWGVDGQHGVLQAVLGPFLARRFAVPAFAMINALIEELEFRGLLMEALLRDHDPLTVVVSVVWLQALLFAVQHYKGGFPCGHTGFALVLVWALVLGAIRYCADGCLLVYLIHVVADTTVALLICRSQRRRDMSRYTLRRARQPARPATTLRRRRRRAQHDATSSQPLASSSTFVQVWSSGSSKANLGT